MTGSFEAGRNPQVEKLFENWAISFEFVEAFPIAEIKRVGDQQVRFEINRENPEQVEEYLVQHQNGAQFPGVVIRQHGNILIDGNTRLGMAAKAKLDTFPAYRVDIPSGDLARALAAQLNQMGGRRLTREEAERAAIEMMENLSFNDTQIGAAVGYTGDQVRAWRKQAEGRAHADRLGLDKIYEQLAAGQRAALSKIRHDEPFKQAVQLVATRKVPQTEINRIVKEIAAAPSEAAELDVVQTARRELIPAGPGAEATPVNAKARRMRMVLPQILNLAPPLDVYEPLKAQSDLQTWREVRAMCDRMLKMYEEMSHQVPLNFEGEADAS